MECWWKSVGSDGDSDWLVVKVVVIVGDGGGCVIVVGISDLTVLWLLGAVEGAVHSQAYCGVIINFRQVV